MEKVENKTNKSIKHTLWVDVLKGIAIILVVVGHNANDTVVDFIFCFHMPLFFLLSGFIFSPKPIPKYISKSTKRLLIPYISFFVLLSFPEVLSLMEHGESLAGSKKLLFKMIYGGSILTGVYGVFWFINVLWISTNLFNMIINRGYRLWLLPLLIVIGYLSVFIKYPVPWNIHIVPMALAYIWIGFIINRNILPKILSKNHINRIVCLIIAIIILTCVFLLRRQLVLDMKYCQFGLPFLSLFSSIAGSLATFMLAIAISTHNLICKIFGWIGSASMVIMYLHQPFKFLILEPLGVTDNFIIILSSLILSIGTYLLLKNKYTQNIFLGI